jgi:adenine/guanine phosphoribosyltransferase-like PRPP-binding protein
MGLFGKSMTEEEKELEKSNEIIKDRMLYDGDLLKIVYFKNFYDKDAAKIVDDLLKEGFTIKSTLSNPLGNNHVFLEKRIN